MLLQVLWFNFRILRRGKPWISERLSKAGINRIQDLYDELNSSFLTHVQICQRFQTQVDVMEYNSILSAIPRNCRNLLTKRTNCPIPKTFLETVLLKKKPTQYLAQIARNLNYDKDACKELWQFELECQLDENTWNGILVDVYLLTNLDYLRWFQYRLVHKIIVTNARRNMYDSNVSDKCHFCNLERETTFHLFIDCRIIAKFWTAWCKWVKYIFKITVDLTPSIIFFNAYAGQQKLLMNTMILIGKQFIYSCKCTNTPLKFSCYLQKVAQISSIEKGVAIRNGKLDKHEKKWKLLLNL